MPKPSQSPREQEYYHDIQDTCLQRWEDEGGADNGHADRPDRDNGVSPVSHLSAHISAADDFLAGGDYDQACAELESAALRFKAYKKTIEQSFDRSISALTTVGSTACPPHPHALKLIRLRKALNR